jgi:hypothetical protein
MIRKLRLVATICLSMSLLTLIPLSGSSANNDIGALAFPEGRLTWQAEGGQAGAHFGYAVASAGDVNGDGFADVIVGEPGYDVQGGDIDPEGRVSVYLGSALGLQPDAAWTAIGTRQFGSSVDSAGDVNGDGFDDVLISQSFAGASVYLGSSAGLTTNPLPIGPGYTLYSGASAGDVNGDGYDDIIMGGLVPNTATSGAAYVFLGTPSGPASTPVWSLFQNSPSWLARVTGAGDVNGDGFDDVLVGFPQYEPPAFPGCTQGYATLVLGSPQGPGLVAWAQAGGANCQRFEFSHFGSSVSPAGDVNGDHFADFFVGGDFGSVMALYLGSASGQPTKSNWHLLLTTSNTRGAGDVDGDGYDDVVVGISDGSIPPIGSPFPRPEGSASLYRGSPTGPSLTPDWTVRGGQDGGMFGFAVDGAGDTDGDGLANIIVGAPVYENGPQEDEGMAFVFFGPPSDLCGNGDRDRDGYCDSGPAADCDDGDPAIRPNAPELCNGRDDNCDGSVDEGLGTECAPVLDLTISFQNAQGQGSGLISWRTTVEHDLMGFNVVLIDNMGNRIQQNRAMIPCEECQTDLGHAYSFFVPKHKSGHDLFIEQVHVDGRLDTFGPAVRH